MKKYKSIINEVPVDGMECVLKDCWKVNGRTLSYAYDSLLFTDYGEAMDYAQSLMQSTIRGEKTTYANIVEYSKDYWKATAMEVFNYSK